MHHEAATSQGLVEHVDDGARRGLIEQFGDGGREHGTLRQE
jgi:hypothetical protein